LRWISSHSPFSKVPNWELRAIGSGSALAPALKVDAADF
jgi:hypothetical protein